MASKMSPEQKEKVTGFFKEVFRLFMVFMASMLGVNL